MATGLFIRLDEALDTQLEQVCRREGFKKSGVIERLVRTFVTQSAQPLDPLAAAREIGIDLSLLRENLRKSPTERLRHHQDVAHFVNRLRRAKRLTA